MSKRRERTNFHYKIDHDLKPDHRDDYLALIRDLKTTIDAAHAWLRERGYALSRSAVARHRGRFLAGTERDRVAMEKARMFAQLAGSKGNPDFAAGAMVQWQHLVFERLMDLESEDDDEDPEPLSSADLLKLGKLVAQSVGLDRARLELERARASEASTPTDPKRNDAGLRQRIDDILHGRDRRG